MDPVVFFPLELTSKIFQSCLPTDDGTDWREAWPGIWSGWRTIAPLQLTAVSRAWREAAQATPSLWNHLVIKDAELVGNWGILGIRNWLMCSGNHPLSIYVETESARVSSTPSVGPTMQEMERTSAVVAEICRHSNTWRVLEADIYKGCFEPAHWIEIYGKLPLLGHLVLNAQ
jgi:hypothetical protein